MSVILIDANNLARRSFSLVALSYQGKRTEVVFFSLRQVLNYMRKFAPVEVIFVWDGALDKRRLQIFPEYKAKRPTLEEEMLRDFRSQRSRMQEVFHKLGFPQIRAANREADDVIATLVRHLQVGAIIVSTDKDYFQLLNESVVYNPAKGKIYDESQLIEEFGIFPSEYPLWKAIVGGHDGIPGLYRVGERGARFIIEFLREGRQPETKYEEKALEKFMAAKEEIERFRRVSELMNVPLEEIKAGITVKKFLSFKLWCVEAYAVLKSLGFNFYLERFAEFMSPFRDLFERRAVRNAIFSHEGGYDFFAR